MAVETNVLPPRYRDPELIGYGGMGEIYRAADVALDRIVAVKVLAQRYAQDEPIRARFTREALAAARLSGEPSTIMIYDVGEHDERPFIVMEHLEGGSLEDRLRAEGAQDPRRAVEWLEQAAAALDAAHRKGVIHRDVKPGNLLLAHDGKLRVADFGVASAAGLDSLTATGTVLGTSGYLAPEQARGEPTTAPSTAGCRGSSTRSSAPRSPRSRPTGTGAAWSSLPRCAKRLPRAQVRPGSSRRWVYPRVRHGEGGRARCSSASPQSRAPRGRRTGCAPRRRRRATAHGAGRDAGPDPDASGHDRA